MGDARVGSEVNIGAGTITCNYDGANKWPTAIDDGAFIGSGSMLVAPVRIGAGATIGAGSTITANAPDAKLTLTRPPQVTVAGWDRPRKLDAEGSAAAGRSTARSIPESPEGLRKLKKMQRLAQAQGSGLLQHRGAERNIARGEARGARTGSSLDRFRGPALNWPRSAQVPHAGSVL